MRKLVITREGVSLRDYKLDQQRITIGRKPDSDVFLNDQTVSSEHAAVSLIDIPAITDLGSTNGTLINGVRISSKTPLHHGDVIRIGQHELKFIDEKAQDMTATVVLSAGAVASVKAQLRVVVGSKAGSIVPLEHDRITVGKPGEQVALVLRDGAGFRLLPVPGTVPARVNHMAVESSGVALSHGDEIEIAGAKIRFEVI
jgi:pSer/pThr/pTyr-binding forkhead associated (FHA) protein